MAEQAGRSEISRRKALKRALVIGAAAWTPPIVTSVRLPAAAQAVSSATNVGGRHFENDTDAGGEPLAKSGQSLAEPIITGVTTTVIGVGLRVAARKPTPDHADTDVPPPATG